MTTNTIKVSKAWLRDFAFCANYYKWTTEEIEEVKQAVREGSGYKEYIARLASAHRNGYSQTWANNFIRLVDWEQNNNA